MYDDQDGDDGYYGDYTEQSYKTVSDDNSSSNNIYHQL